MKKLIQFVILSALLIPSFLVNAQGEEKNIISRRHYEKKEKTYTEWYNKITFNVFHGAGNIYSVSKAMTPSVPYEDFSYKHGNDTSSWTVVNLSYERLKKDDMLYYGPGIAVKFGDGSSFSASAYLRGRYELYLDNTFLGYDVSGLHPYASAAIGLSFLSGTNGLELCYYHLWADRYSSKTYLHGWYDTDSQRAKSGIKFYLDYSLGFAIDCGKHKSIIIGYQAMLHPCVKNTLDLTQYANEIDDFIQNSTNNSKYILIQTKEVMKLYHGVELSFRF